MDNKLKYTFPNIRSADLYQMMFHTSLVRAELGLRKNAKKKKTR